MAIHSESAIYGYSLLPPPEGWNTRWHEAEIDGEAVSYLAFADRDWGLNPNPGMDVPRLFLEFAEIQLGERFRETAMLFANRYGPLGKLRSFPHPADPSPRAMYGELESDWRDEVSYMVDTVELWKLIESHDTTTLRNLVRLQNGWLQYTVGRGKNLRWRFVMHKRSAPHIFERFLFDDIYRPARFVLCYLVEAKLAQFPIRLHISSVGDDLAVSSLDLNPDSLLGGMWMHFARIVSEGRRHVLCDYCRKPTEAKRNTKLYCSNNCRIYANRKKEKNDVLSKRRGQG